VLPDATAEQIRLATARYVRDLKESGATEDELSAANACNLTNSDQRALYDEQHPPCGLLRLRRTWSPVFDDRALAATVLRRELVGFLRRLGTLTHPMSDLDRSDFSADFRHCELLDGHGTAGRS
jgi:hypothetical protein